MTAIIMRYYLTTMVYNIYTLQTKLMLIGWHHMANRSIRTLLDNGNRQTHEHHQTHNYGIRWLALTMAISCRMKSSLSRTQIYASSIVFRWARGMYTGWPQR